MFAPVDVSELSSLWGMTFAAVAVKGLVLLALALAGSFLLRRAAASTRHFLWTATVVGMLALPFLGNTVPGWSIEGLGLPAAEPATEPVEETVAESHEPTATWFMAIDPDAQEGPAAGITATDPRGTATPVERFVRPIRVVEESPQELASTTLVGFANRMLDSMREWSPWTWALLAWELGVLLVLGWLAVGWIGLHRLEKRCRPVTDEAWTSAAEVAADEMGLERMPKLLRTDDAMTPLAWGVFRARVLVPANGDAWTDERRIDVLRHEFAHVARRDVLTQLIAQIACAVFWFHPLPWMAATRMRLERERAADDRVLLAGSRASAYAGHLLDMARTLRSEHGLAAASIGMARRSQLGERMDSLLDEKGRPRATSKTTRVVLGLFVAASVLPLAALQPAELEAAPPDRVLESDNPYPAPPVIGLRDGSVRVPAVTPVPPVPEAFTLPGVIDRELRRRTSAAREAAKLRAKTFTSAPRVYSVAPGQTPIAITRGGNPAVVVTSDNLRFDGGKWTMGALTADGNEISTKHTSWRSQDDDRTFEVEVSGRIRFNDDETDVELLDDDSYFDLFVEEDRDRRRMEIELDRDGNEVRRYFVRGRKTEIDDEARAWFATQVSEFMMMAGINTEERVQRWIDEDGVDATIDRLEDMDRDMAAASHWAALLRNDALEDEDVRRALRVAGRRVDSDFHKAQILGDRLHVFIGDPETADETVAFIESIDSDFSRGQLIREALEIEGLDDDLRAEILVLADGLDSDFEKGRVLAAFPGREFDPGSSNAFFRVLRGVDSDFEKTRALIEALPLALDDSEARESMWRAIEDIDSDFERANLIAALAPKLTDDAMVLEALEVVDGIDSDFEKARALGEFVDVAADSDAVRDAFTRVAESIDSDHEYGRIMRELSAAGR